VRGSSRQSEKVSGQKVMLSRAITASLHHTDTQESKPKPHPHQTGPHSVRHRHYAQNAVCGQPLPLATRVPRRARRAGEPPLTNAKDSGVGSLRDTIEKSNLSVGVRDTIQVSSNLHISILPELHLINAPVIVSGGGTPTVIESPRWPSWTGDHRAWAWGPAKQRGGLLAFS